MESVVDIPTAGSAPLSIELPAPPGPYVLRLAVARRPGPPGQPRAPVDARWKSLGGIETPGLVLFRSALGAELAGGPVFGPVTTPDHLIAQLALTGPFAE